MYYVLYLNVWLTNYKTLKSMTLTTYEERLQCFCKTFTHKRDVLLFCKTFTHIKETLYIYKQVKVIFDHY